MTNAIEQTKREMYDWLAQMKSSVDLKLIPNDSIERFEPALEAHLEELRKVMVNGNETTVRCANHSLVTIRDLEARLAAMTANRDELARSNLAGDQAYAAMKQERDDIQLRLHAVDHAYSEQQLKAGTCGQVCADRGASEQADANMAVLIDSVRGAQDIMVEYLVPDGIRAKRAMTKLVPLLDNEKLYSALYELEHEKT